MAADSAGTDSNDAAGVSLSASPLTPATVARSSAARTARERMRSICEKTRPVEAPLLVRRVTWSQVWCAARRRCSD